jgi:hypothetical protein
MKRILFIITILTLIIGSCYYDSEEFLYPKLGNNCDTTNITFATSVISLLQNNCQSCHSNSNAATYGNNLKLQNYSDVYAKRANILSSIKQNGATSPMPKGGAKMKDCIIREFEIWINNGAPNN